MSLVYHSKNETPDYHCSYTRIICSLGMVSHLLATSWMVQASHPDIVSGFIFHEISTSDADLFTFTGIPASMVEFPALNS